MAKLTDEQLEAALLAAETHPLLSAAEIAEAKETARKKIEAKLKKAALDKIIADETTKLELAAGNGLMQEMVWINIDLAPFVDRINIDGRVFFNDHAYQVTRSQAMTIREIMSRGWDHEADIKGESLRQKLGQWRIRNFDKIPASAHVGVA